MRRFSKKFILANDKKYYLVSIKNEFKRWEKIAFFQKSDKKDEFGFMIEGDRLNCPNVGQLSHLSWIPLPDIWLNVPDICKKCWGSHQQPDGRFNCVLRNLMVEQYDSEGLSNCR